MTERIDIKAAINAGLRKLGIHDLPASKGEPFIDPPQGRDDVLCEIMLCDCVAEYVRDSIREDGRIVPLCPRCALKCIETDPAMTKRLRLRRLEP